MDNKKTTILIVGYDENKVKSFSIHTHFIKHFFRYAAALSLLLVLFIAGLMFIYQHINNIKIENFDLADKLFHINKEVDLIDSMKLNDKMKKIDNNLYAIHSYLQARGVLQKPNTGGESSQNQNGDLRRISYFEEQSDIFLKDLEQMPLGYPYNGEISSLYGYRYNPFGGRGGEFHPGIDFKGSIGDKVYATADGVVERSDWYAGYGLAVVLRHDNGLSTLYGHLSHVNVSEGERVKAGDVIGYLGSTGRSTGPHVHYEIRKDGIDIDPNPFLKTY